MGRGYAKEAVAGAKLCIGCCGGCHCCQLHQLQCFAVATAAAAVTGAIFCHSLAPPAPGRGSSHTLLLLVVVVVVVLLLH
jgi:hypothetical protein